MDDRLAISRRRPLLADFSVRVGPAGGGELGEPATVERHAEGVPGPYFPLATTFPEPGKLTG